MWTKKKNRQERQNIHTKQSKTKSKNAWESGTRDTLSVFSIIYLAAHNRKHISSNAWARKHANTMSAYSRCLSSWHLQLSWSNTSVSPFQWLKVLMDKADLQHSSLFHLIWLSSSQTPIQNIPHQSTARAFVLIASATLTAAFWHMQTHCKSLILF